MSPLSDSLIVNILLQRASGRRSRQHKTDLQDSDPCAPNGASFDVVHGTPTARQCSLGNEEIPARLVFHGAAADPKSVGEREIFDGVAAAFFFQNRRIVVRAPVHHGGHHKIGLGDSPRPRAAASPSASPARPCVPKKLRVVSGFGVGRLCRLVRPLARRTRYNGINPLLAGNP